MSSCLCRLKAKLTHHFERWYKMATLQSFLLHSSHALWLPSHYTLKAFPPYSHDRFTSLACQIAWFGLVFILICLQEYLWLKSKFDSCWIPTQFQKFDRLVEQYTLVLPFHQIHLNSPCCRLNRNPKESWYKSIIITRLVLVRASHIFYR